MGNIFDIFKKLEADRSAADVTPAGKAPLSHIVVGLGNPGRQYERTRHNTGFLCMDALSEAYHATLDRAKFRALVGEVTIAGVRCLLMKPQTMMNASGLAVAAAARFYHVKPSHVIVISDDINLPVGGMRVRSKGSDGGQKGIRSIIQELGSDEFPRIRIGVGAKPSPDYDLADWVLSNFSAPEMEKLKALFPVARDGLEALLRGDPDAAMRLCNRKG